MICLPTSNPHRWRRLLAALIAGLPINGCGQTDSAMVTPLQGFEGEAEAAPGTTGASVIWSSNGAQGTENSALEALTLGGSSFMAGDSEDNTSSGGSGTGDPDELAPGCTDWSFPTCTPGECPVVANEGTLPNVLAELCESIETTTRLYEIDRGCEHVRIAWWDADGNSSKTYWEVVSGGEVGGREYLVNQCPTARGAIPKCNAWRDLDPCGSPTPNYGGAGGAGARCNTAREEAQAFFDSLVPAVQECISHDDCGFVSFGNRCGAICPLPMNPFHSGDIGTPFYQYDDFGACDVCIGLTVGDCPQPPATSYCVGGRCQFLDDYPEAGQFAE